MGTLNTICDRARVKIRDVDGLVFTDAQLMGIVNGILEQIYQTLCQAESALVYGETSFDTVDGTMEYTPAVTFYGILDDGMWVDGEDTYLQMVSEADKIKWDYESTESQPEAYYLSEDSNIGLLWVPDAAYTIHYQYYKPLTAMSTFATDALPWGGIWNLAIERMLIVECMEVQERDASRHAVMSVVEWDKAMNITHKRGIRSRKQVSDLFSVNGI